MTVSAAPLSQSPMMGLCAFFGMTTLDTEPRLNLFGNIGFQDL